MPHLLHTRRGSMKAGKKRREREADDVGTSSVVQAERGARDAPVVWCTYGLGRKCRLRALIAKSLCFCRGNRTEGLCCVWLSKTLHGRRRFRSSSSGAFFFFFFSLVVFILFFSLGDRGFLAASRYLFFAVAYVLRRDRVARVSVGLRG